MGKAIYQETPWLLDSHFVDLYEHGRQEDLFIERCRMVFNQREQQRWKVMPANRYKKSVRLNYKYFES